MPVKKPNREKLQTSITGLRDSCCNQLEIAPPRWGWWRLPPCHATPRQDRQVIRKCRKVKGLFFCWSSTFFQPCDVSMFNKRKKNGENYEEWSRLENHVGAIFHHSEKKSNKWTVDWYANFWDRFQLGENRSMINLTGLSESLPRWLIYLRVSRVWSRFANDE